MYDKEMIQKNDEKKNNQPENIQNHIIYYDEIIKLTFSPISPPSQPSHN